MFRLISREVLAQVQCSDGLLVFVVERREWRGEVISVHLVIRQ